MFRIIEWVERLCARIGYRPENNDPALRQALARTDAIACDDSWFRDVKKKYEKRLVALQKKTTAQRSKAEQAGINTERTRRLEHHLAGLRRSLD